MADYFYVHKKILPDYLEKVLEAREMLELMRKLSESGSGACDHSAIAKYYEELGGVKFSD